MHPFHKKALKWLTTLYLPLTNTVCIHTCHQTMGPTFKWWTVTLHLLLAKTSKNTLNMLLQLSYGMDASSTAQYWLHSIWLPANQAHHNHNVLAHTVTGIQHLPGHCCHHLPQMWHDILHTQQCWISQQNQCSKSNLWTSLFLQIYSIPAQWWHYPHSVQDHKCTFVLFSQSWT